MRIESLQVHALRCFEQAEWDGFRPGLNLVLGPNGAGKTTLLEAVHLLSYGRSFRTGARDALVRRGSDRTTVSAHLRRADQRPLRVALERSGAGWAGRIDGQPLARLSDLFQSLAVCTFEPGSHELIAGPGELRRAYLDWGLFHVEPQFLVGWRRYQRALKQTNALLKAGAAPVAFEVWHHELAHHGAQLDAQRRGYVDALRPRLVALCGWLVPELGSVRVDYRAGWDAGGGAPGLQQQLARALLRDRDRCHTSVGPHRADLVIGFEAAPRREHLSRGQEKLLALATVLAQAEHHRARLDEPPLLLLDDLASELDQEHLGRVLDHALAAQLQVLITATEAVPALLDRVPSSDWFHVERTGGEAAASTT